MDNQEPLANASREEVMSALFMNLVVQQTQMAFMLLGRIPHPESGEVMQDFEGAKFFIDQLEMIEVKTKGNLDKREEGLLKQSLTSLRMAFVEAVNKPAGEAKAAPPAGTGSGSEKPVEAQESSDDSKKKFSKKY
jgi:hypothetical protein